MSSYRKIKWKGIRGSTGGLFAPRSYREFFVDDINGNDANPGTSRAQAWQTLDPKVNGETFRPTDHILLIRDGEWRETLIPPSSGIAGKPVIFGAYGSGADPVINGADIITGWAVYGAGAGSTWQSALATESNQVFMDEVRLTEGVVDRDNLNDHEWIWVGNVLYVRDDTGDPDGTGVVIEASVRTRCVDVTPGKDYLVFDGLILKYANVQNIAVLDADNISLKNIESAFAYNMGCYVSGANFYIGNNSSFHDTFEQHGLYLGTNYPTATTALVEFSSFYNNGLKGIQGNPGFDEVNLGVCIIRYNALYDNSQDGVSFLGSDGSQIYYNLTYGNAGYAISVLYDADTDPDWSNACLNCEVYNNTSYNDGNGFYVGARSTGHIFKNNIVSTISDSWIIRKLATGTATFDNNLYFPDGAAVFRYEGVNSNFADWKVASSQDTNSPTPADPLMTNPGADDFTLQAGSPCRDAGVDVSLTRDYADVSVPQETNPAIGAYEYVA